jgi:hypothetical protein
MIGIPSPVASHRRLFSPLADRQRAAALFNGAMQPRLGDKHKPKPIRPVTTDKPFDFKTRQTPGQTLLQPFAADRPPFSNPHRSCKRRQRPSSTRFPPWEAFERRPLRALPTRARARRPKPFTIADGQDSPSPLLPSLADRPRATRASTRRAPSPTRTIPRRADAFADSVAPAIREDRTEKYLARLRGFVVGRGGFTIFSAS